ncbi:PKD domain-containing protein [Flammeovirgaceae bacterium SG7u.111]|nr:PKD domain-containing protein [Flammeovirgaceae bacterium SG7u.132]WPO37108.1 PKD domain-containing protein [Flammeovirgaceae bacterium SG7u.111]
MAPVIFQELTDVTCLEQVGSGFCYEFNIDEDGSGSDIKVIHKWYFGDGETSGGRFVEHCYDSYGTYEVMLVSVQSYEGISFADTNRYRIDVDQVIKIKAEKPGSSSRGFPYYFDGSDSFVSNDYEAVDFYWDFGDGNYGCNIISNHQYDKPGKYTVTLMVRGLADNGDEKYICGKKSIEVGQ